MTITESVRIAVNEAAEATREAQRHEMILALVGLVDAVRTNHPGAQVISFEPSDQGPWLTISDHDGIADDEDIADDAEGYASHLYTVDEGHLATRLEGIEGLTLHQFGSNGRHVDYLLHVETFLACPLYADIIRSLT